MNPSPIALNAPIPGEGAPMGLERQPNAADAKLRARTVGEVVALFLRYGCGAYAPHSLENRTHVLRLLVDGLGDLPLADAQPGHLLLWLDAQTQWKSSWSVRTAVQAIQRCFNWAKRMGFIAGNPFAGIAVPEGDPRRAMTEDELRCLLRNTDALFRRLLLFLRWTGCRPGEAAALEWPMVDWSRGVVVLQKHKTRKKTGKPRVIVLTAAAQRLLAWMHRCRKGDTQQNVFVNRRGTPWNRSNLSLRIQRLRRKAGVAPDAKLHGIRHLAATAAIAGGASVMLVSQALGHSSVQITQKYYVDLTNEIEAIRQAMEPGK